MVSRVHGQYKLLELTVGGEINLVRELGNVDVEAILHVIQNFGIILVTHKSDCKTLQNKFYYYPISQPKI